MFGENGYGFSFEVNDSTCRKDDFAETILSPYEGAGTDHNLSFFFLLFASPFACGFGQTQDQAAALYETAFRLPLSHRSNGIDGYLELRQDVRLTPKLSGIMWGTGDVNINDDPELATFKGEAPRNAVIQVVDQAGKVLELKKLERPLAKVRTVQLYGDSRLTYLLTVDYSAGFGSYSGPITTLVEVKSGQLWWVESTEARTGRTGEISLMESLKTTWKFVDAPGGKGKQILLAQCRPDWSSVKDDQNFTTTYVRFYFDGIKWLAKERTVKGISEFDQGFPSRKYFP